MKNISNPDQLEEKLKGYINGKLKTESYNSAKEQNFEIDSNRIKKNLEESRELQNRNLRLAVKDFEIKFGTDLNSVLNEENIKYLDNNDGVGLRKSLEKSIKDRKFASSVEKDDFLNDMVSGLFSLKNSEEMANKRMAEATAKYLAEMKKLNEANGLDFDSIEGKNFGNNIFEKRYLEAQAEVQKQVEEEEKARQNLYDNENGIHNEGIYDKYGKKLKDYIYKGQLTITNEIFDALEKNGQVRINKGDDTSFVINKNGEGSYTTIHEKTVNGSKVIMTKTLSSTPQDAYKNAKTNVSKDAFIPGIGGDVARAVGGLILKNTDQLANFNLKQSKSSSQTPTQNRTTTVRRRVVSQPRRVVTQREPTKWESMSQGLKKAVKDLESKAGKMGKVILDTSDKLAKLELAKLNKFADALGMSESDKLFQEIAILEKQKQIALEVGNIDKVKTFSDEIKKKKKQAENAKFYDDMNDSYEQKTDRLNFKPSEKQSTDFEKLFNEYYNKKMDNLERLQISGLISKEKYDAEILNTLGELKERFIELKDYEKAKNALIESYVKEMDGIEVQYDSEIKDNAVKGDWYGLDNSEIIANSLEILKKEREAIWNVWDKYQKDNPKRTLEDVNKDEEKYNLEFEEAVKNGDTKRASEIKEILERLLKEKELWKSEENIKNKTTEIKETKEELESKQISDALTKTIEDAFKNINPKDIKSSLQNNINEIFEKSLNANSDIQNIYHDKFGTQFSDAINGEIEKVVLTGNFAKDQLAINQALNDALMEVAKNGNEAARAMANFMIIDNIKGNIDELSKSLSTAGAILKDDFLTNMSLTMSSLSGLLGELQKSPYIGSQLGGVLGGVNSFLTPATSIINTVMGVVGGGVSLFRSLGFGGNKKHNEEEKKKSKEWFENKTKENESLFKEINSLTDTIQNLTTKLIQNIATDTSDKNIAKQSNYYNTLIDKTGDLYDSQITATGHSSKKKLFGGKKDSYSTFSKGFDEYFGDIWKNTARDSGSLQKFYDTYLQNFNIKDLLKKLGKSKLDNNNIEEVKKNFLRFIEDIKVMEKYSDNLPKNGILESFEGVEVADLFELRNEYQKQLEDIYKGMGKDPEKYRDEILNTVNSLIQNDQVIISAFQDVKSRTIEQLSSGNDAVLGLATGLESYFGKLKTNFAKVFYDLNFQGIEERFSNKFGDLTNKLADFRLSGRRDFDTFINENLDFWGLFNDLKNTESLGNDMKGIIDTLKQQAKSSGLSDEIINAMFPDEKINEKTDQIKNALENSIRKALETNSFEQFSMSLGDSIYNNVKDSLVKAFYESQSFQSLADKYFLTDEYKNALDGAGSFKDAYDIIRNKLDEVELKLQSEGMDFKGTNAVDGNYYGMTGKQEYKTSGILDNSKGVEFAVTLNNYGFMSNSEFMSTLKREMKEFLYESGKEEV